MINDRDHAGRGLYGNTYMVGPRGRPAASTRNSVLNSLPGRGRRTTLAAAIPAQRAVREPSPAPFSLAHPCVSRPPSAHAVQAPERLRLEPPPAERALWLLSYPAVQALPAEDVAAGAGRRLPPRRQAERAGAGGCAGH
eukprot:scaffold16668_cov119-Isochrysis_galbana.AAC.1